MRMNGHTFIATKAAAVLHFIPKQKAEQEWPMLQRQLTQEPDLWKTQYTLAEIEFQLWCGKMQLWVAKDGEKRLFWALSTVRPRANDGQSVLTVWWMRGERFLENMPVVLAALRTLAEQKKFHSIIVTGRPAWAKVLRAHGFKHLRTEVVLEL